MRTKKRLSKDEVNSFGLCLSVDSGIRYWVSVPKPVSPLTMGDMEKLAGGVRKAYAQIMLRRGGLDLKRFRMQHELAQWTDPVMCQHRQVEAGMGKNRGRWSCVDCGHVFWKGCHKQLKTTARTAKFHDSKVHLCKICIPIHNGTVGR